MDSKIIREIEGIIGKENVLASEEERKCYSYDGRTAGTVPDLIVLPTSAQDVSAILKLANKHLFPIVPRGQGTGLTGGSVPARGGVVLSLTRMNRILEIDAQNLITVVEPGVITFVLQQEVAKQGLVTLLIRLPTSIRASAATWPSVREAPILSSMVLRGTTCSA